MRDANVNLTQIARSRPLAAHADPRLIVLRHGNAELEWEETWQVLQAELAALSSNSELRVIEDASHMIQVDRPDAVTDAVLDVDSRARL